MNGCSELDSIQTRNRIVPLLIIGFVLLLSCGCKHASAPPSAPAAKPASINKPIVRNDVFDGRELAQDLIAAGFTPLVLYHAPSNEKIHPTKVPNSILYTNAYFSLDEQGRVIQLMAGSSSSMMFPKASSTLQLRSYKGDDVLSLSRREFHNLYGYQTKVNAAIAGTGEDATLHFLYRKGNAALIKVEVLFEGLRESDKIVSIRAVYLPDPGQALLDKGKDLGFYSWPKAS
jgi:hypothetical protein